jgi:hypothetical protein
MPAKLNVGVTRKISDGHYGSRGASVSLEIELDHQITREPVQLHAQMAQLFRLVQQAVSAELERSAAPLPGPAQASKVTPSGEERPATRAQIKAVQNSAQQKGADLAALLQQHFGVCSPEELTVRQASALIGSLRSAASPSAAEHSNVES